MTATTPLKSSHGKSYLQTYVEGCSYLTFTRKSPGTEAAMASVARIQAMPPLMIESWGIKVLLRGLTRTGRA